MKIPRSYSILVATLVMPMLSSVPSFAQTPNYSADKTTVANWLVGQQYTDDKLPSFGGIRVSRDPSIYEKGTLDAYYLVVPYRGNLAAMNMMYSDAPNSVTFAQNWAKWFFTHLTPQSAPLGVPYNHLYRIDGTNESTSIVSKDTTPQSNQDIKDQLDASDSAIATFFSVLWGIQRRGGSIDFATHKTQIANLGTALLHLKQSDGLYRAKDDLDDAHDTSVDVFFRYLEDQSEVCAGWRDLSSLYAAQGMSTEANQCTGYADDLQGKILQTYYNRFNDNLYAWAKDKPTQQNPEPLSPANLNEWYASTQAQMWPNLWDVVAPDDAKTQSVVQAVNTVWNGSQDSLTPQWWTYLGKVKSVAPNGIKTYYISDGYINSGFAYAMFMAGQKDKVALYLATIKSTRYPNTSTAFNPDNLPFLVDDAGWLLRLMTDATDSTAPTISISTPSSNQTLNVADFTKMEGLIGDGTEVAQVKLRLSRVRGGSTQYWNGNAFTATSTTFPAVLDQRGALSGKWTFVVSPALRAAVDEGAYTVSAIATDRAGNSSTANSVFTLSAPPTISINDISCPESGTAVFTVSLSVASTRQVRVDFTTANGTATQGQDYVGTAYTVVFDPGQTTKQISVTIKNDDLAESNETFFIKLSAPINATLARNTGTGTIIDDDSAPPTTAPNLTGFMVYQREGEPSSDPRYKNIRASSLVLASFASKVVTPLGPWNLQFARNPHISPDGSAIVFTAYTNDTSGFDVFYWKLWAPRPINLTAGKFGTEARDEDVSWIDSSTLLFKRAGQIYTMALDTQGNSTSITQVPITSQGGNGERSGPVVTLDGNYILYWKNTGTAADLYRVPRNGGTEVAIAATPGLSEYYPTIWKSGGVVLYSRGLSVSQPFDQVYSLSLSTNAPVSLPFNATNAENSDATPVSDRYILFSSTRTGSTQYDLYLGDSQTGQVWTMAQLGLNIASDLRELGADYYGPSSTLRSYRPTTTRTPSAGSG